MRTYLGRNSNAYSWLEWRLYRDAVKFKWHFSYLLFVFNVDQAAEPSGRSLKG